jgi:hypothetical protein
VKYKHNNISCKKLEKRKEKKKVEEKTIFLQKKVGKKKGTKTFFECKKNVYI